MIVIHEFTCVNIFEELKFCLKVTKAYVKRLSSPAAFSQTVINKTASCTNSALFSQPIKFHFEGYH
jgi:hypothetical protein